MGVCVFFFLHSFIQTIYVYLFSGFCFAGCPSACRVVAFSSSIKIFVSIISINRFSLKSSIVHRAKNNKYVQLIFTLATCCWMDNLRQQRKKKEEKKATKFSLIGSPAHVKSMSVFLFHSFCSANSFPWKIIPFFFFMLLIRKFTERFFFFFLWRATK